MTKDMTAGSPMKLIISFAVPLMFGNLFQQLYSMVDTIIVGRFLGKESLAAVGSTGSLNFLIIGFCLGLCSGFAIPVSQRFGAKDFEDMRRFIGNIIWLSIGFAAVVTLLTVIFCRPMLIAMNTPEDIIDEAYAYIVVIFAGIPATFFYNILASLLRALGDSKTPVVFLIMASIINIFLDFALVVWIPMGVAGAAVATVASQFVSGAACLIFIIKKFEILHISRDDAKIRTPYLAELCGDGLPMGLQFSITAIGSILLQTSVNALGSTIVAAVTAAGKLNMLCTCAFDALSVSMSTYGGQNIGARKVDRILPGLRSGMIIGSIYSIFSLIIIFFFGKPMTTLFVEQSEIEIIEHAYQFLLTSAFFYIPLAGVNIFRLMIQGMGYSKVALFAGVFEMVARGIFGLWLVPTFGFVAACFANPFAWIMADLFLVPTFIRILRHVQQWGE
ncbi:MAG: MATE family efflux transporter [Massiliimalia sp.]|jgi:putative MATE family efflux protein